MLQTTILRICNTTALTATTFSLILLAGCGQTSSNENSGDNPKKQNNATNVSQTAPASDQQKLSSQQNVGQSKENQQTTTIAKQAGSETDSGQQKTGQSSNQNSALHFTPEINQAETIVQDDIDKYIESQGDGLTLNGLTNSSSPSEVTETFLRTLAARQNIIAERMLTLEARVMTNKVGLQLSPVASQKAKYVTDKTTYATNRKKIAFVKCHVHDPQQGANSDFSITWVLKRNNNNAWRISGMKVLQDNIPQLISFENKRHVTAIAQSSKTKSGSLDDKTSTERYASGDQQSVHR